MRKLKKFNGIAFFQNKQYRFYVGATSVRHLIELMESVGIHGLNTSNISNYWYKGTWGTPMNGIELVEPCIYWTGLNEQTTPERLL